MRAGVGHDDGPTILSFQQISRHGGFQRYRDPGGRRVSLGIPHRDRGPRFKRVLMGHMNPKAPWDHIGALDPSRVEAHSRGWMLPSSHLIFLESPDEAARRIAR